MQLWTPQRGGDWNLGRIFLCSDWLPKRTVKPVTSFLWSERFLAVDACLELNLALCSHTPQALGIYAHNNRRICFGQKLEGSSNRVKTHDNDASPPKLIGGLHVKARQE